MFNTIDRMSRSAFKAFKWLLTAVSGVITTGFILALET
jgi:hypothetical protein